MHASCQFCNYMCSPFSDNALKGNCVYKFHRQKCNVKTMLVFVISCEFVARNCQKLGEASVVILKTNKFLWT